MKKNIARLCVSVTHLCLTIYIGREVYKSYNFDNTQDRNGVAQSAKLSTK